MSIIAYILLAVVFSAFFSGIEIAYISSNKFHIEIENKKGNFSYQLISLLIKNPANFIAAMLVGNNVALVIYGMFMPELLSPYLNFIGNEYLLLLVQTIISTLVILVVAEFLPKAIFSTHSTRLLEILAVPSAFFYGLFYLVVKLMVGISNFVMHYILKAEKGEAQQVFDKVDLDNYIRERTDNPGNREPYEDPEIQIFKNALEFSDLKVREFMIPRTEIVAQDVKQGLSSLKASFIESSLSKILIYKDSIDNIIGYTHSFELFKKPQNIRSILRPVSFIPESMPANEILNLLIRERRSIAVVLDEFGGTSGLVTIEDVVEEIFGEIDDEHDVEDLVEEQLSETEYRFSARQEIDYLNEKYELSLPESENYSTLSGLIIDQLESIPAQGERLFIEPYIIIIEKVSNSRIEEVKLRRSDE